MAYVTRDAVLDVLAEVHRDADESAQHAIHRVWELVKALPDADNKIPYDERKRIYAAALEKWGAEAQMMMVIEEMSELTKELCKLYRGKRNLEELVDEMADVTIMLEQLDLILGVNERVRQHMDMKVTRLKVRIDEEDGGEMR